MGSVFGLTENLQSIRHRFQIAIFDAFHIGPTLEFPQDLTTLVGNPAKRAGSRFSRSLGDQFIHLFCPCGEADGFLQFSFPGESFDLGIQIGSPIRDIAAANPASNLARAGYCADVGSTRKRRRTEIRIHRCVDVFIMG